jgi:hypothetical protein
LGFVSVYDSTFLGTTYTNRCINGVSYNLPLFRVDKLLASTNWRRTGVSDLDFFQKLIMISILLFADKDVHDKLCDKIKTWYISHNDLFKDVESQNIVRALMPYLYDNNAVLHLHLGLESFFFTIPDLFF